MWNVCPACGLYSEEKEVLLPNNGAKLLRAAAKCLNCGAETPFLRLPLFIVSGASGTGKSTLVQWTASRHMDCVHLESDILWGRVFDQPEDGYRAYRNLWLRMCKNIHQAGRPVVLYGSSIPEQWENCPERRYIGEIHMLALVCAPDVLANRLHARPAWRGMGDDAMIDRMQRFNAWLVENPSKVNPSITLLDTTHDSIDDTGAALLRWIGEYWNRHMLEDS